MIIKLAACVDQRIECEGKLERFQTMQEIASQSQTVNPLSLALLVMYFLLLFF